MKLFGPHAIPDLEKASLYNRDFLHGFAHLSLFRDAKVTRRINYAHLDVEELGSVYESLLDFHPFIANQNGELKFELRTGTQRKSTGSYYTRPELVQELIKSALEPVIEERLAEVKTQEQKAQALLSLKVCDPASGSGHFLLAAARRIGKELAKVRTGEEQPTPTQFRKAVREVIQHCIYGVDLNPLAVDLCKVALWLEGHSKGLPLTFLDHHIKCGNSLIGVMDLNVLTKGIPDDAFKPVTGADKKVAAEIKRRNKKEREEWESGQERLRFDEPLDADTSYFAEAFRELAHIPETAPQEVHTKADLYEKLRKQDKNWLRNWHACNLWTAAFFTPLTKADDRTIPTTDKLLDYLRNPNAVYGPLIGKADVLTLKHNFFHWSLEFPEVMAGGGFDVVLGNPPWEELQLREKEFFELRAPEIAALPGDKRKKKIQELLENNAELAVEFEESRIIYDATTKFLRKSGRFQLTAVGKLNTYVLFAGLFNGLIGLKARAGLICPTGIVTDDTTKFFLRELLNNKSLTSLFDFENIEGLFPAIQRNVRFCLFTVSSSPQNEIKMAAQLSNIELLSKKERNYVLSITDMERINPNTLNCPTFKTASDAKLVAKIHNNIPILYAEASDANNTWQVSFRQGIFNSTSDSSCFKTREELETSGYKLLGNSFQLDKSIFLPLYEAKLAHQFNHRAATFAGIEAKNRFKIHAGTNETTHEALTDPDHVVIPRYWVNEENLIGRIPTKPPGTCNPLPKT